MFLIRNNQTPSPVAENTICRGRVRVPAGSARPGQGDRGTAGALGAENLLEARQTGGEVNGMWIVHTKFNLYIHNIGKMPLSFITKNTDRFSIGLNNVRRKY